MMEVQRLHRRITRQLPALWIAAVLALACCGTALAAATSHAATKSIAGKWKGHYGGAVSGHFTLQLEEDRRRGCAGASRSRDRRGNTTSAAV